MTKQELEEKIKNNESVFRMYDDIYFYDFNLNKEHMKIKGNVLCYDNDMLCAIDELFSTKAEAQHYLDNGNVTRTEKLPYITWEEFKNGKIIAFMTKYGQQVRMCKWEGIDMVKKPTNNIMLFVDKDVKTDIKNFDYTEENFYKAYEVCRKLFKGEDYD